MKKEKNLSGRTYVMVILVILVGILVWAVVGLLGRESAPSPRVAVLMEESAGSRWTAFRMGLEQGARDYGIDLELVPADRYESAQDQIRAINQQVQTGAKGYVICPKESRGMETVLDSISSTSVVILAESDADKDVSEGRSIAAVTAEDEDLGRDLAAEIISDLGQERDSVSVMVIAGNRDRFSTMNRALALQESLEQAGLSPDMVTDTREITSAVLAGRDIAVVLDNGLLEQAAAAAADMGNPPALYGVGCSSDNAAWLDREVITCMAVPDDFSMGYQSMAMIARKMKEKTLKMTDTRVGYRIIRPENMYEDENEQLLFPAVE